MFSRKEQAEACSTRRYRVRLLVVAFVGQALACLVFANAVTLPQAVKAGDKEAIRSLLKQHTDVNLAEADGTTALHWAVEADDVDTAQLLLKAGANANTVNRNGVTPLWLASANRDAEMVSLLLKAGADPNRTGLAGETILMTASRAGNSELVELLLSHGAAVNAKGADFGETALMLAAAEDRPDAVRVLVKHGAEISGRSTALKYNKDRFGLEGVLTILPHGSWTPLMYAARQGSINAVRALAESGADLTLADPDGSTALLLAITNGHYDTAAYLVEKGADPNQVDSTGMAALYAAVDMHTLGEVFGQPLRPSPDKLDALGLMKVLFDHGANPNAGLKTATLQRAHTPGEPTLGEGATPLMRAAKNGDAAAIELLIAHGANVSQTQKNKTTALMFAAGLGRGVSAFAKDYGTEDDLLAAAKLLVDHGADVNAVSAAGQTAMHFAAQAMDANFPQPTDMMVKFLAAHGAKLDVVDSQGRSPIEMAQGKGLRGHAGGPVAPRDGTVALLRQLMSSSTAK